MGKVRNVAITTTTINSTKSNTSSSFPELQQQSIPGILVFSYSFVRNIRCIKWATLIGLFKTICVLV